MMATTPLWVRERLHNWGRWLSEQGTAGTGYPRSNILAMCRGSAMSSDHVPVDSMAAGHTHRAVTLLRGPHDREWMALQCRYVGDPKVRPSRRRPLVYSEMAPLLCVSEKTARVWVADGEWMVMQTLDRCHVLPAL